MDLRGDLVPAEAQPALLDRIPDIGGIEFRPRHLLRRRVEGMAEFRDNDRLRPVAERLAEQFLGMPCTIDR